MLRRSDKKARMAEGWFPLGSGDGEHILYVFICLPVHRFQSVSLGNDT